MNKLFEIMSKMSSSLYHYIIWASIQHATVLSLSFILYSDSVYLRTVFFRCSIYVCSYTKPVIDKNFIYIRYGCILDVQCTLLLLSRLLCFCCLDSLRSNSCCVWKSTKNKWSQYESTFLLFSLG